MSHSAPENDTPRTACALPERALTAAQPAAERIRFGELLSRLKQALRQPATAALIAVIVSYKMGESMADVMWKPLLLDRGFSSASIGLWAGTFGMLFSLLGSSGAGYLARHVQLHARCFGSLRCVHWAWRQSGGSPAVPTGAPRR